MNSWSDIAKTNVELELLEAVIGREGRPVHINVLARAAIRSILELEAVERPYAPGSTYAQGDQIRLDGNTATVEQVLEGSNPTQGAFKILTLLFPDGTKRLMAAEVSGAPTHNPEPVSEDKVRSIVSGKDGSLIRSAVQEALEQSQRFTWFQDAQGDWWCSSDILPQVTNQVLGQVWPLLQKLLVDGVLNPRPTEEIVAQIWGLANDGSDEYVLHAFALNSILQSCQDVRWLSNGWVLEEDWTRLQERPVLTGPRQPNVVQLPVGVKPYTAAAKARDRETQGEPQQGVQATPITEDFEFWLQDRLLNAQFTLNARHYYGRWLPLTTQLRKVFPPFTS